MSFAKLIGTKLLHLTRQSGATKTLRKAFLSYLRRRISQKMNKSTGKIVLSDGIEVPILGLGTWRMPTDIVTTVVEEAIDLGYRHLDCAHIYGNECEIGVAIANRIKLGVIKREDLFVTSKLWNTFHKPDLVRPACEATLRFLQIPYLDSYLVHWPMAYQEGCDLYPKDSDGKFIFSDVDYVDTWRAMEALCADGLCRTIGLSNFNKRQIERILAVARVPPTILQIECHPYLNQRRLIEFCREKRIAVTAYSPLGSPSSPYPKPGETTLLKNPKISEIAERHGRSPAEILLRYQMQREIVVVAKSTDKCHLAVNLTALEFQLSQTDMSSLDSLDINGRFMIMAAASGHPHHPFENDEF